MADQGPTDKNDAKPEEDRSGFWFGIAMCGGIAVLMIVGWLGRGSVTL